MIQRITHDDGTIYWVNRIGSGRWHDTYAVHSVINDKVRYWRVSANDVQSAITKARAQYAQSLGL